MPHSLSYSALIPPNLFILAALIGVLLAWRRPRFGLSLATAAIALLYLASTPLLAYCLIRSAEALAGVMPAAPAGTPAGAIVVLSGDFRSGTGTGNPDRVGPVTLERLAQAARLERRLHLPVLVSGGRLGHLHDSLAGLMSRALDRDFQVPVRWREERSRNTWENALYSATILERARVPAALVVTDPWHMARALWAFHAAGYPALPAPTPEPRTPPVSPAAFLPQVPALLDSYYALHEMIGLAWYVCRHRPASAAAKPSLAARASASAGSRPPQEPRRS